jgi:hypothetical protein
MDVPDDRLALPREDYGHEIESQGNWYMLHTEMRHHILEH